MTEPVNPPKTDPETLVLRTQAFVSFDFRNGPMTPIVIKLDDATVISGVGGRGDTFFQQLF